jgi:hypothetical protein
LSHLSRHRVLAAFALATWLMLAACSSTVVTPGVTASPSAAPGPESPKPALPSPSVPRASAAQTANTTGFAFTAEDIVAYYEGQGYACAAPRPSAKAVGFMLRSCDKADPGRTGVIGLVTAPDGGLANGFASVKGKDTETILAPIDALDPLSGFLGATLGEEQGTALLTWLASHLGDTYAETMSGPLKVATFTEAEDDHSTLYVEVANQAYLDAPPVESP